LLPGEKTSTRVDPAKSLYAQVEPAANQEGITNASIWVGYAWADEPRNHAAVVETGEDKQKVADTAEELAKSFSAACNEFEFIAPTTTLEKALDKAIASNKVPFFISDMGDNPTAGGAGDVTWTLREILQRPAFSSEDGPSLIYASIPDSDFVKKAVDAGVGGNVSGLAGAEVDDRYAPPIKLEGTVTAIEYGDRDAVIEAVVQVGSIHVIVTQKRKPY